MNREDFILLLGFLLGFITMYLICLYFPIYNLDNDFQIKSKSKIVPKMLITDIEGISDTTYIYFNQQ